MIGLSLRIRTVILWVTLVAMLVLVNHQIADKQGTVNEGTAVLLQLAPRDPRSLMAGDYMTLRYAMADKVVEAAQSASATDGRVVLSLDGDSVASFVGLHAGVALLPGQQLLRYRRRGEMVRLASDAFFFEEGQAQVYEEARYGELRVDETGDAVLVGLRDAQLKVLGRADGALPDR